MRQDTSGYGQWQSDCNAALPATVLFLCAGTGTLRRSDPSSLREIAMPSSKAPPAASAPEDATAHLDMPPERRAAARAHAAMLSRTADKVARELPMSADVEDFRRVLAEGAKP